MTATFTAVFYSTMIPQWPLTAYVVLVAPPRTSSTRFAYAGVPEPAVDRLPGPSSLTAVFLHTKLAAAMRYNKSIPRLTAYGAALRIDTCHQIHPTYTQRCGLQVMVEQVHSSGRGSAVRNFSPLRPLAVISRLRAQA